LARTLGRTLQELAESITAEEYALWWAEYRRSPWGELRSDVQSGIVAATVANVQRGSKTKPYKATDFMPWHESTAAAEAEPEEEDERDKIFRMMNGG
jgi:hypothetical protein